MVTVPVGATSGRPRGVGVEFENGFGESGKVVRICRERFGILGWYRAGL